MHSLMQFKRRSRFTLAALLLWGAALPAQAAWVQEPGHCFVSKSFNYYSTTNFVRDNGRKQTQPRFTKYEMNLYGECGWRDGITLGVNAFLHQLDAGFKESYPDLGIEISGSSQNYGLADPEIFARFRLWEKDGWALAFQPILKFPSFYWHGGNPQGGTDDFDIEPRMQLGYGFDAFGQHHYARLDAGYRKRLGDWGDQWKLEATLGLAITDSLTLLPQIFVTERVDDASGGINSLAVAQDYDLTKGQISFAYQLTPQTSVQLGVFTHLHARNTGDGDGVIAGLWYRF